MHCQHVVYSKWPNSWPKGVKYKINSGCFCGRAPESMCLRPRSRSFSREIQWGSAVGNLRPNTPLNRPGCTWHGSGLGKSLLTCEQWDVSWRRKKFRGPVIYLGLWVWLVAWLIQIYLFSGIDDRDAFWLNVGNVSIFYMNKMDT